MPEPDSTGDETRASPPTDQSYKAATTTDVPTRIGKFEVRALLGEGAFGRVFLAFDAELERQVAIKVPKPEGLTTDLRERFIREARATAKIHHPNVCPVYHVGTEVDPPYIVMHYLAGTTLAAHLDKWKVLPPLHAVALAQKLALGMAAAHEKGVIHRDLKPQNVLFDPTRQLVLITDFGLARIGGQPTATAAGAVFGTPLYMSPEQARGEGDQVGPLSDVYSLGIILYRMLTGNVPFDGGVYEVLIQHCEKAPVPPSAARRGLDPRLDRLCLKALEKKPADRYVSAKAFADALSDYMHTGDSTAWQVSDDTRGRKPANPIPAPAPQVPPIPPAPLRLNPTAGNDRKSAPVPPPQPPAPAGTRPAPVLPIPAEEDDFQPVPADDGAVRQKVLIGGITLLLFLLMLAGLAFVLLTSKKQPTPEQVEVLPPDPPTKPTIPTPPQTPIPNPNPPSPPPLPSIANGFAGHKFDQEAERRAAEWALAVGAEVKITPTAGELKVITKKEELPPAFTVSRIEIRKKPNLSEEDMKTNLAGLTGPVEILFWECGQVGDDLVKVLARIPKLKTFLAFQASRVTDGEPRHYRGPPRGFTELFLQNTSVTKQGVKHVPSRSRRCSNSRLSCRTRDEWLQGLASMEGLTSLNLNASGSNYLSKSGLRLLKPYMKLQHLTLLRPQRDGRLAGETCRSPHRIERELLRAGFAGSQHRRTGTDAPEKTA